MKISLAIIAGILSALLAGTLYVHVELGRDIRIDAGSLIYELPDGATIDSTSTELATKKIIASPALVFRLYARVTRYRGRLKAGEYQLLPGMTERGLLQLFRSGKVFQRQITFVEGWTFSEWRQALAGQVGIRHTIKGLSGREIMKALGDGKVSAEGEFFPDTYHYTRGETDLSILRRAHERMMRTLDEQWREGTDTDELASPYQALILASIIEKETGYAPDRAKIARVFINRLQKHMKLQSDPTTIYGLKNFNGDLTKADLSVDSPYNTYVTHGLPPTPICNPGLDSIHAALNPAPGDYYYFVARGDGRSAFSRTLAQHNRHVARFQKAGRVSDYHSAPTPK